MPLSILPTKDEAGGPSKPSHRIDYHYHQTSLLHEPFPPLTVVVISQTAGRNRRNHGCNHTKTFSDRKKSTSSFRLLFSISALRFAFHDQSEVLCRNSRSFFGLSRSSSKSHTTKNNAAYDWQETKEKNRLSFPIFHANASKKATEATTNSRPTNQNKNKVKYR